MKKGRFDKRKKNTSKFISLILRHKPELIGISLDEHGWADVKALIEGINRTGGHFLDADLLEDIVRTDEKQRYSFNEDRTLIRANQGHSIPVDVELEQRTPPDVLYHGTGEKYVSSIDAQGLIPKGRLYVHLSSDTQTARKVGSRHGRPVIYQIDCRQMIKEGYLFYLSANKVWLTKAVPVLYMKKYAGDMPGEGQRTEEK
jgi:putative RNA 2'-phosphotransferase